MGTHLFVATSEGIRTFERGTEGWEARHRGLEGIAVTSVTASKYAVLAGTQVGIFISKDRGASWRESNAGLTEPHVRWLDYHLNDPWLAFAGTEPAAIFVSSNGAESWRECAEVADMRDANGWSLPYSPEAGCVRGFAFHGSRGYAAVEQGGLLRSDDGGHSWRLAGGSTGDPRAPVLGSRIHADVHSVTVHPSSEDLVFAPTGGGLFVSEDGGETWSKLYECYCRAVWVDAQDPKHLILGPADGVDSGGRVERTTDGGKTWAETSEGLGAPWPNHMVDRLAQVGDELVGVLSNGGVITAPLADWSWRPLFENLGRVLAVVPLATQDR